MTHFTTVVVKLADCIQTMIGSSFLQNFGLTCTEQTHVSSLGFELSHIAHLQNKFSSVLS